MLIERWEGLGLESIALHHGSREDEVLTLSVDRHRATSGYLDPLLAAGRVLLGEHHHLVLQPLLRVTRLLLWNLLHRARCLRCLPPLLTLGGEDLSFELFGLHALHGMLAWPQLKLFLAPAALDFGPAFRSRSLHPLILANKLLNLLAEELIELLLSQLAARFAFIRPVSWVDT